MIVQWLTNLTQSNIVLFVLATILLVFYLVKAIHAIQPFVKTYKVGKKLDEITNGRKPHWLYGHTKSFGSTSHEEQLNLARLSSRHPTMFNTWWGPHISLLRVFHPALAQTVFNSGATKDEFGYQFLRPWLGDGLVLSRGAKWKRNRLLLTPVFHFNALKPYMKIVNQTSSVMVEKWKSKTKQVLDVTSDVSLMTLDTMMQCIMSTKTDCQLQGTRHPYISAVRAVTRSILKRFRNPLQLMEWYFRWTENGQAFYKNVAILHGYTEKIISERRRVRTETNEEDKENKKRKFDFLHSLLESKDENGKGLTDQEIRDEVNTFVFAGHDTTSSGISWAIYNLAKHPHLQERCRREIELICEGRQEIEWEDLSKMTYVAMFIKESLRLYPPAVAAGKFLEKPLSVKSDLHSPKEVALPTGSSVYIQISALHRHQDVWENPEEFDPERFTKDNCSKRHPHAYIPFSAGSRNCIGQHFAMNEMKVVLSQIVRNFRIYLDDETPKPKMELRIILQSQNGIHVKLEPIKDNQIG